MAAVLDQLRAIEQQVERRLRELAPLVAEYRDLQKVAERLGLKSDTPEPTSAPAAAAERAAQRTNKTTTSRRASTKRSSAARARTRTSTASTRSRRQPTAATSTPSRAPATKRTPAAGDGSAKDTATRRRRRVAAPGSRQQDVLKLVSERPGITVAEIAKQLGVDAAGLYRVVRRLQADGQIRKDGTALHPNDAATPPPPSPTARSAQPTGTQPPAPAESPTPTSPEPAATES